MSSQSALVQRIASGRPLVADADFATALYNKGIYVNQNFEGLNLSQPELIRSVMHEFKQAGAQLLHTNTVAASHRYLMHHGLQTQQQQIISAACQLATDVATPALQNESYVIGSLGPLESTEKKELQDFTHQIISFVKQGVQGLAVMGCPWGPNEGQNLPLKILHSTLQVLCDLKKNHKTVGSPRSQDPQGQDPQGQDVDFPVTMVYLYLPEAVSGAKLKQHLPAFAKALQKYKIDVAGFTGPLPLPVYLELVEVFKTLWSGPLALRPCMGPLQSVHGHNLQLCNPDYMAKYAGRFIQAGVQIMGASSGLGVDHVRGIARSLKMLSPQLNGNQLNGHSLKGKQINKAKVDQVVELAVEAKAQVPRAERSKLGEKLFARKRPIVSVEIVPPHGVECEKFFAHCQALVEGGVEFVNIPDSARAQARMSSLQMASYVNRNFKLEAIPHFTTRDRNLIGLQADLVGSYVNGVHNVLVVTGDPPKVGNCPQASAVYDVDAVGLTQLVHNMNCGQALSGSSFGKATGFLIGVALNPMAQNTKLEIERLQAKLQAGADFIITQPIYDAQRMKKFLDAAGPIDIPIVMGLWPLVSARNAEFLKNEVPGVFVPQQVVDKMKSMGGDKKAAVECGVDMAINTLLEAKSFVQGFQVSAPFNRVSVALQVAQHV